MANDTLQAGLLGFIGGFAGGKVDDIALDEQRQYDEALRLRKEEAAILKQRRLLQLGNDMSRKFNKEALTAEGLMDQSGALNLEGLDKDLADMATETNYRALREEQIKRNTTRTKQAESIKQVGPDTKVFTGAQLEAALEEGPITTQGRQPSAGEIRTQWNVVLRDVNAALKTTTPPLSNKHRELLADSSIDQIMKHPDAQEAFMSLTQDMAKNKVVAEANDAIRNNPSAFGSLDTGVVVDAIKEKQGQIMQAVDAASKQYIEAFDAAGITDKRERNALARRLISEGTPTGDGGFENIKQIMTEGGFWNPSIENIMIRSMLARRVVGQ